VYKFFAPYSSSFPFNFPFLLPPPTGAPPQQNLFCLLFSDFVEENRQKIKRKKMTFLLG
jgi:hypothetical protein